VVRTTHGRHAAGRPNPLTELYAVARTSASPSARVAGAGLVGCGLVAALALPTMAASGTGHVAAAPIPATSQPEQAASSAIDASSLGGSLIWRRAEAVVPSAGRAFQGGSVAVTPAATTAPVASSDPVKAVAAVNAARTRAAAVNAARTRAAAVAKAAAQRAELSASRAPAAARTVSRSAQRTAPAAPRPAAQVASGGRVIGNNYPGWGGVDPFGFFGRQCTSFVAWRLNSANGVGFSVRYRGVMWGNASSWGSAARSVGIAVNNRPARGAVAWSPAGHVGWVARVNGDGTVTIEEYNWNYNRSYHTRTVPVSNFQYIHVADLG